MGLLLDMNAQEVTNSQLQFAKKNVGMGLSLQTNNVKTITQPPKTAVPPAPSILDTHAQAVPTLSAPLSVGTAKLYPQRHATMGLKTILGVIIRVTERYRGGSAQGGR